MKQLLIIALAFLPLGLIAQQQAPPQGINYQAVAIDNEGNEMVGVDLKGMPVAEKEIRVRFSILKDSETGILNYREQHLVTTDAYGLFNTVIGQGIEDATPISFNQIDWGTGYHFLKVEIDIKGGTEYKDMGTQQLWSVPYSLYSKYADTAGNGIESVNDNGDGTLTFTYLDGSTYTTPTLTGLKGPQGDTGPQGPQGDTGNGIVNTLDNGDGTFTFEYADGTTFTTSNLTGQQGIQGVQGPIGATGPQGATGNGIASTVDNGDGTFTFTYDDGTTFTTSDLTGPQGAQGTQGIQGIQGPAGPTGATGPQGAIGNGIASTVDNGDGTFTFTYDDGTTFTTSDLTGPQGATGAQGIQGVAGANGTNGLDGNGIASTVDNGDGTFTFTYDDGTTFTTSDLTGPAGSQDAWSLTGNAGTNPTTNFIGTTDAQDVVIKSNNSERIRVLSSGEVGIGASPDASAKLDVSSTSQGFLPPRLTLIERNAIVTPSDGLIIFNTTTGCPNYFYDGTWYEWCGIGVLPIGLISDLNCGSSNNNGNLIEGSPASGVSSEIPYTGGNGGTHNGQTVSSTGVTGLTATLVAGTFANGAGTLIYDITGSPNSVGTASFAINLGGQTCVLNLSVANLAAQYPIDAVFCASGPTTIIDVTNPSTGQTWMDRNLGASQVATSSTDAAAYGDLYQWGRRSDGHQCRNSATTASLSSIDQPAHGDFIIAPNSPNDWLSPQNMNLWQGINGVNNPCPNGYRLPTSAELSAETSSWNNNTSAGAFSSPLRLTIGGYRHRGFYTMNGNIQLLLSAGALTNVGTTGYLWSSSASGTNAIILAFGGSSANSAQNRAFGYTIRCIKN